jgi:hypothetical protein
MPQFLNSTPLLPGSYSGRLEPRNSTEPQLPSFLNHFAELNTRLTVNWYTGTRLISILVAWDPRYITSRQPPQETRLPLCCMLIHLCRDVFTAPLRSNERVPDRRKHRSSIVVCVRFHMNLFTEQLFSNKLFWLSGVMSQYYVKWKSSVVTGKNIEGPSMDS